MRDQQRQINEAGTQPTANITWPAPRRTIAEAGEVAVDTAMPVVPAPLASLWWRRQLERVDAAMADISEKTKVTLQIGGVLVLAAAIFTAGQFWGDWGASNRARDKTLERHELAIDELRKSITEIKETAIRSEASQKAALDAANRADGKGTAILLEMATLREALAARGVNIARQP